MKAKPEIFQDLDDALFNQLPANYRLLKKIEMLPANLSESTAYKSAFFSCEPLTKPISKILSGPTKGADGEP